MWSVYEGLQLDFRNGYKKVKLHIYSKLVYSTFIKDDDRMGPGRSLIQRTKHLANKDWEARIRHIYWEANKCVLCRHDG